MNCCNWLRHIKKTDLTGAITSVNSDAISRSAITSLDQALQGRAAGVQMTTNTGILEVYIYPDSWGKLHQ
jgi:hypothetical protein